MKGSLGPIFIVGMPRSGTKLLRDLLNMNPLIGIPEAETHFIPYLIEKYGRPNQFNEELLIKIYDDIKSSSFFFEMEERGKCITDVVLLKNKFETWEQLLSCILRFYAPDHRERDFLCGDKTPGYLNHLALLKSIFPNGKFIHIIRDPRDYALSVRKAWGKNIYRASESWKECVEKACIEGSFLGGDYHEVFFEKLLSATEDTLFSICEFLKIHFSPAMLKLQKPSENLGDAKNLTYIVKDNKNKFNKYFSRIEIKKIEEITYPILKSMGYKMLYAQNYKPLTSGKKLISLINDIYFSALFHVKDKGFLHGLHYFYIHHQKSSWHN